jgi:hypothetical protein
MSRNRLGILLLVSVFFIACENAFGADNVVTVNNLGVGNKVTTQQAPATSHDNVMTINLAATTTDDKVEIDQSASGHLRQATQDVIGALSTGNSILIVQAGSLHEATQTIDGKGNDALIDQSGKMNKASQTITGEDNYEVTITQAKSANEAWQEITGSVNTASIEQKGRSGWAKQIISSGTNNIAIIKQQGQTVSNWAKQDITGDGHDATITQVKGTKNRATQTLSGLQHIVKTTQNGSNNVSTMTIDGQDHEVTVKQTKNRNNSVVDIDSLSEFVIVDHKQDGSKNTGWGKTLDKGINVIDSVLVDIDVDQIGNLNKADVLVEGSHHINVVLNQEGNRNKGSIKINNSDHYNATLNQVGTALTFQMVVNGQSNGSWTKTQN